MGRPYILWVGYETDLEPSVILPENIAGTDEDGGGEYDISHLAEYLNGDSSKYQVVLPWIGGKRVRRNERGEWYVEERIT